MLDELFPIEDGLLTLEHGSIKEARYVSGSIPLILFSGRILTRGWISSFFQGLKHMGEPAARPVIQEWLDRLFGTVASSNAGSEEAKMLTNGVKH